MTPEEKVRYALRHGLRAKGDDDHDGPDDELVGVVFDDGGGKYRAHCAPHRVLFPLPYSEPQALDPMQRRELSKWTEQLIGAESDEQMIALALPSTLKGGGPLRDADRLQHILSVGRAAKRLAQLFHLAIDGRDYAAQVTVLAIDREARRAASQPRPKLRNIELRRVRLIQAMERLFAADPDVRALLSDESHVQNEFAWELPWAIFLEELEDLEQQSRDEPERVFAALASALRNQNSITREAAKFSYALDVFGDRSDYRCNACFEDKSERCDSCQKRHPADPVITIEKAFAKALAKRRTG